MQYTSIPIKLTGLCILNYGKDLLHFCWMCVGGLNFHLIVSFSSECGSVKGVQLLFEVGLNYFTIINSNTHILSAPSVIHPHILNVPARLRHGTL